MLLSPSARKAIGLSLQECLVLVDEAHNLPEALRQLHSSALTLPVIEAAQKQLQMYFATYRHRLRGENIMNIGNLIKVLKAFAKHLKNNSPNKSSTNGCSILREKENQSQQAQHTSTTLPKRSLQSTNEFLLGVGLGHIKLINLQRYLENSGLSQKLLGFTRSKGDEDHDVPSTGLSKHVSAMAVVQTYLEKLNLKGEEGKIVSEWPTSGDSSNGFQHPTLRYVLLQPASCFDNVLEEAHAVALVGGTLSPFGHVAAELLAGSEPQETSGSSTGPATGEDEKSLLQLSIEADIYFKQQAKRPDNCRSSVSVVSSRFAAFTCDHVIDKSRIFLKCLSFGPNGQKFDFRHQSRMASAICEDLGQAILQLCQAVPNGLVVFLPSYSYEAHLVRQWQHSGLFDKINQRKKVFREPKSAQQLDMALRLYSSQAAEPGGALLLSVIGGKMSEGINLSNSMARGVVVVGLPYPDSSDPILREKMTNLEQSCIGGISGQAYYQNLCMRAVNQSCGRSIRHAHDYAAIILCDYRYASQSNIWEALPKWLRAAPSSPRDTKQGFGAMTSDLKSFFGRLTGR
jgi:chromosome transmission fidelity protein 1